MELTKSERDKIISQLERIKRCEVELATKGPCGPCELEIESIINKLTDKMHWKAEGSATLVYRGESYIRVDSLTWLKRSALDPDKWLPAIQAPSRYELEQAYQAMTGTRV